MKPEKLSDAIGMIDDDIIEEADRMREEKKKSRKPIWIALGSVAACAVIAAAVVLMNIGGGKLPVADSTSDTQTSVSQPVESSTPPTVTTSEPVESSTPPTVTTSEPVESSTPSTVTTSEPVESSTPPTVTTSEPVESSTPPTVTTSEPVESSTPPTVTTSEPDNVITDPDEQQEHEEYTLVKAVYPDLRKPVYEEYASYEEYDKDWATYRKAYQRFSVETKYAKAIPDEYFSDVMKTFLLDNDGENVAFSPVNSYMALAMVAETADGNSRQQILDVLGADSIDRLRECAYGLWKSCYNNSTLNETLLANSMWLSDAMEYNTETLQPLADHYYASAFSGKMGSEEYNKLLQSWLNENTGGLLENEAANVEFDTSTVFGLASTVYYKAQWYDDFKEADNTDGVFTTADGEEQQAVFMNFSNDMYSYHDGDGYIATYLDITEGDRMWLLLPDKGTTPEQLIENGALNELLYGGVKDKRLKCEMHFSMPKFDITSQCDLVEGMRELGITDIFDRERADFSPLGVEVDGAVYIDKVNNAVRVSVDEKGVSAASYIYIDYTGDGLADDYPVIDFKLDRPFIFLIENNDDMVLFCGIVNNLGW